MTIKDKIKYILVHCPSSRNSYNLCYYLLLKKFYMCGCDFSRIMLFVNIKTFLNYYQQLQRENPSLRGINYYENKKHDAFRKLKPSFGSQLFRNV